MKKLSLSELKVKSFVTCVTAKNGHQLVGGGQAKDDPTAVFCPGTPVLSGICMEVKYT